MMRKLFFVLIMVGAATAVFAQAQLTDTGSVTLQGVVAKRVEITVTGVGNYNNLDLTTDATDLAVVEVNEYSNVREGYEVKLTSLNAGAESTSDPSFKGALGGESLTYTVKYDSTAVSFTSGEALITDAFAKTGRPGANKNLTISYAGSTADLVSDTYSDDLTFTITAK